MDPYLRMLMAMESGGQNIINHSGATSATGLYGFTKPAFKQVQIDNPELRNVTWEQFQQTPDIQHTFAAKLKDSVTNRMSTKGIPVTPLNVYKYWFLGPAGAENFLNKPPETPLSQAMSPEAIAANPWVNKFQTVGGLSAELNRRIGQKVNMETPAQQTAQPTFAQLEAALGRARAANNPAAVEKLTKMLQEPLAQARVRALEAGNEVAANKIIQRMQALGFDPTAAAPSPVAPPAAPQITEAPVVPGAAPMGAPTQDPDFDPSQRDMGGLGAPQAAPVAPQAAPEAPVAPVAAPVAPPAAPAPRTTAEMVSGAPAPVTTLPTTTVTAGPAPVLTDAQLESDPKWIGNARRLYEETEGKPFAGSDVEAAKWLKDYAGSTKWNTVGTATTIYDALKKLSPEGKQALLDSIKVYGSAPTSGESVRRAIQGIATDPTTWGTAGIGALLTKTLGRKAAEKALLMAVEEGLKKQLLSTSTKQAVTAGAGYGALNNTLEQGVQVAADGQESIDPTKVATAGAIGGATGGTINKIVDKVAGRAGVRNLAKKSGTMDDLQTNTEIISKLKAESENPAREIFGSRPNLQRREVNARVTTDIVDEARKVVNDLPNDFPNKAQLVEATKKGINNSQRVLKDLAGIPGGQEVVDIINKAVRADRLTSPNPANQNFFIKGAKVANDWFLPLPGFVSRPINYMLKPRSSSEDVTKKLIDNYGSAADRLMDLGAVSPGTKALRSLQEMQQQAAAEATTRRATLAEQKAAEALAKKTAQEEAKAAAKAQDTASRNSVLQATGMPLGGPFQELLQGGRSGLNLTTDQAVEALRIAAQKNKGNPIGEAANQVRRSSPEGVTDPNAFYGLQNDIRKLQERGVLGGQTGALSEVTQGSGIRNPISYAANVRTAEAALKVAQESAPNNALAQFANVVARTKSPEAKAALVQQRLLKTTDQAEIDYLTNFIEPLTRFGAKSK